ncbi:hypothetical protein GOP47_0018791 [Adiantum capillus-veneris]|uniref:Uncharacterized protein n=1 Tax=Adiantum capillus-veneris TaxID=13818 RepID=A0A9D4UED1_ADICA|nr:hypothetical protein GOP47_0018791 [Adiantum capillus-veneris]
MPPPKSSESVSTYLRDIIFGILNKNEVAMEELLPMINVMYGSDVDIKDQINQKRDLAMDCMGHGKEKRISTIWALRD